MTGDDEGRIQLAGEYVLGVLSPEQAVGVEVRMARDPALAAAVSYWERRLHGLTAVAQPEPAPERLWRRIEAHLDGPRLPAPTPLARAAGFWERLWENAAAWRAATAMAAASALVIAALSLLRPPVGGDAPPAFVAVLQPPQGAQVGYLVEVNVDRSIDLIPLVRPAIPPDRTFEFWTLADPAQGPVSLGLVEPGEAVRLPPERAPAVGANQLFELTLEPASGSPTGRPTGPIQFVGRTAAAL